MELKEISAISEALTKQERQDLVNKLSAKYKKTLTYNILKENPEWMASILDEVKDKLKGDKGDEGPRGPQGFPGKPGRDGKNGLDGRPGKDGKNGRDGRDGVDGVSIIDASIAADGSLVVTLSNGNEIDCGKVLGEGILNQYYSLASSSNDFPDLRETLVTAAPNATRPVVSLQVTNALYTDIDVAVMPQGAGAILAQIPDGTGVMGNKRGLRAIDFQTDHNGVASRVASGEGASILSGRWNTASGIYSSVLSGTQNTASNSESIVCGGFNNVASGDKSTVIGGTSNTASGFGSCVIGGESSVSSGALSSVIGKFGTTNNIAGQLAFGHISDALGRYQTTFTGLYQNTTNATPTRATAGGGGATTTNQLTLRNNSASFFEAKAVAYSNAGDAKQWTISGLIKRGANAGTTALVGTPTVTSSFADTNAASWTIAVASDTTNGSLAITVTGAAATTIRWFIEVMSYETQT